MLEDSSPKTKAKRRAQESGTKAKRRARKEARQQADAAREEVGRMAYDMLEEYFPEQARQRRQSGRTLLMLVFVVGVALGMALVRLVGR